MVHQTPAYGIGVDAYNINFDNYISTIVRNGDTLYVNSGGVRYRGLEYQGTNGSADGATDNAGPSIVGPNLVNVLPRTHFMLSAVADF